MNTNLKTIATVAAVALATLWSPVGLTGASVEKNSGASTLPAETGVLQVQVNVPISWRPMLDDRIQDALFSYVRDEFQRRGFEGKIVQVDSYGAPDPGCCLLTIDLAQWRMNHIGDIDCTFTANLQTDDTTRYLGIFSGMAFQWMRGRGTFGLADSFEAAAEDAVADLYSRLAETELIPGLRRS